MAGAGLVFVRAFTGRLLVRAPAQRRGAARLIATALDMPIEVSEPIDGKRIKAPKVSPELDKLFVEGLRQIREHWDARGYRQELIVLIYDEPTERLLERCKGRYDLLKTVMPDTRVYGVVTRVNEPQRIRKRTDRADTRTAMSGGSLNEKNVREALASCPKDRHGLLPSVWKAEPTGFHPFLAEPPAACPPTRRGCLHVYLAPSSVDVPPPYI
jgi:hypothetical protein